MGLSDGTTGPGTTSGRFARGQVRPTTQDPDTVWADGQVFTSAETIERPGGFYDEAAGGALDGCGDAWWHHGDAKPENVWARGRLWSAVRIGVPAGLFFGLFVFVQTGSGAAALFEGVFFGVFLGAASALVMWKSWRGARDLKSYDRVTVARIVSRGEAVMDVRLAPAVLDYANVIRRFQERNHRQRWVLWIVDGLTLIYAVAATFGGSVRSATFWWVLAVIGAGNLLWRPRRRARVLANANRAEYSARLLLSQAPAA